MNKAVVVLLTLIFSSIYSSALFAQSSSDDVITSQTLDGTQLLNQMREAIKQNDYEITFINSTDDKLNAAFKYRHISIDKKPFAQLLYLEGPAKEIILRENMVSYYQQDRNPFSISSARIIEVFPDIVFNDFDQLSQFYDYFVIGKARVANRSTQLIRILAKDKDRYNYVIWLDDKTAIPLRIDLYDLNNELLEQVKVVELSPLIEKDLFKQYLDKAADYPIVVASDKVSQLDDKWTLTWLPAGFSERSHSQIDYKNADISTRLYSDGVFSFTVNVSEPAEVLKPHSLQKGNQIIYITYAMDKEIMIIADLPLETIKKIAQHIEVKTSS